MKGSLSSCFQRALAGWVSISSRFALLITLLATVAAAGALDYTIRNIGISTDTGEMFSPDLPFRRAWQQYKDAFPKQIDTFVVVIDGENPQQARQQAAELAERLRQYPDVFDQIDTPGVGEFYDTNGLLFLDGEELKDLADRLSLVQPFLARLSEDPSMRGLFTVTNQALEQNGKEASAEIDISELLQAMDNTLRASQQDAYTTLPWQELMTGKKTDLNDRRAFLIVRPFMDFSQLFPAAEAIRLVREAGSALGIDAAHGMQLRITGELAMEFDELQSVSQGAAEAAVITLLIALLILWFTFRSFRMLLATLLTLFAGLILTAAFATWAVGTLNMISVAFAVLYIGLSLDFTIHFGLHYRELLPRMADSSRVRILAMAAEKTGHSLLLCTLTTAVGFYAFIPTAYDGVSELGVISGTGMFISFALTMTLFPALLNLRPFQLDPAKSRPCPMGIPRFLQIIPADASHPLWRGVLLVALLLSLCSLPLASFDYNPLNLRAAASESVSTFEDLVQNSDPSPWYMTVLTDDAGKAEQLKPALEKLPTVDKVITLHSYIPAHQDDKLDRVDEISLLMGPQLSQPLKTVELDHSQAIAALQTFRQQLTQHLAAFPDDPNRETIDSISQQLDHIQQQGLDEPRLANLQHALVGSLPANLTLLGKSLKADYVSRDSLPESLEREWIGASQEYRVAIFPRQNISDSKALRRFVDEVRSVEPQATGSPVNYLESGDAVVNAFRQAITGAILVIALLLLLILKNWRDATLTLIPLLIAGVFTVAFTVLFNIPFNFANIIALPLLLGIGVDNGIHMVQRFRAGVDAHQLMDTSTSRGILFSALTTVVSFLSLAFSAHPGTASMGVLLTTGMLLTVIATLVVLPALLKKQPTTD